MDLSRSGMPGRVRHGPHGCSDTGPHVAGLSGAPGYGSMKNHQNGPARSSEQQGKKKLSFPVTLERFGLGGITSLVITVILINLIWVLAGKGTNLREDALVIFDVIGGVLSLVTGGVCGLILGGIWKNRKAPLIGGAVIGLIGPLLLQVMLPRIFP